MAKVLLFLTVIIFTGFGIYLLVDYDSGKKPQYALLSPLAEQINKSVQKMNPFSPSSLSKDIRDSLNDTKGEYAIVVKNLKTDENFSLGEEEKFETASLYKLWIMAVVFQNLKEGKLKEDQVLFEKAEVLNDKFDIATESAEIKEGEITMTVQKALEQMITISHNYAALLLSARVRLSNVSKFLKEQGFENSSIGVPPRTTAKDIALFYEKLYKGEIIDKESSMEMIELLKRQQLNDRIPKFLPEEIEVAHKTGEIDGYKHDAGIVFTKKGDYIIVVLSKTDDPQIAAAKIAGISRIVFDYFKK